MKRISYLACQGILLTSLSVAWIGCAAPQVQNPEPPTGAEWSTRAQGYHSVAFTAGGDTQTTTGSLNKLHHDKKDEARVATLEPAKNIANFELNKSLANEKALRPKPAQLAHTAVDSQPKEEAVAPADDNDEAPGKELADADDAKDTYHE